MYNELPIKNPAGEFSAFLQEGFYENLGCGTFHNHNYAEVHLILDGTAVFVIGGEIYEIEGGRMLVIPKKTLHACTRQDEETRHTAFQINYIPDREMHSAEIYPVDVEILRCFFEKIKQCRETNDHTELAVLMSLFCCHLFGKVRMEPNSVLDYGFAIHEFFLHRYHEDICLCDLAETLHLSQRQTERLVTAHMGKSFRETLAATRVMIAKQLSLSTELSMHEIAEYVGYRSYAGFWKAMKKFDQT